jgi:hypothetical protein
MRVSIWQQDRKGARWYRLGVVIIEAGRTLPFKRNIPHGDSPLFPIWPRLCWYTMESHAWTLFDRERRPEDVTRPNGNT